MQQQQGSEYSGPPLGTGAFQHEDACIGEAETHRNLNSSFLSVPELGSKVLDPDQRPSLTNPLAGGISGISDDNANSGLSLGSLGVGFGSCEGEERRHIVCWNESSRLGLSPGGTAESGNDVDDSGRGTKDNFMRRRKCCIEFANGDQQEPRWR